ncbi:hypothetical protein STEG23_030003, partial [Scotinomys teguina]
MYKRIAVDQLKLNKELVTEGDVRVTEAHVVLRMAQLPDSVRAGDWDPDREQTGDEDEDEVIRGILQGGLYY